MIQVNEVDVSTGTLHMPLVGTWVARFVVLGDDTSKVTGPVTLRVGSTQLVGSAVAGVDPGGLVMVQIVGGAGGLQTQVAAKHYRNPTIRSILVDILSQGGETLSSDSDEETLSTALPHWTTTAECTIGDAIIGLLRDTGADWRVLPDGTVWVGPETWPDVGEPEGFVLQQDDPNQKLLLAAADGADVLPGSTYQERQIKEAVYLVSESAIRAELVYGDSTEAGMHAVLKRMEDRAAQRNVYSTVFRSKVVGMNSDGTVELVSQDSRFPNMSRIPLRATPGISALKCLTGTQVIVAFEGSRGSAPFATVSDLTACDSVTITAQSEIDLTAPTIKAGGEDALVLFKAFATWANTLGTTNAGIGLVVPPVTGLDTQILKGS